MISLGGPFITTINNKSHVFTYDIVIWGEDVAEVRKQVDAWSKAIGMFGMQISKEKSNIIVMTRDRKEERKKIKIILNKKTLEVVKGFK